MENSTHTVAGLILAGGASARMGRDKALVEFLGEPLISHAVQRLAPQVGLMAVSANADPARFRFLHCPVLPDTIEGRPGPLAGIAAGLRWAAGEGCTMLATSPCDAPYLPRDLLARLSAAPGRPSVAQSPQGPEPLFALWPVSALDEVQRALEAGEGSVLRLISALDGCFVAIAPTRPPWWANLNDSGELQAAETLARGGNEAV